MYDVIDDTVREQWEGQTVTVYEDPITKNKPEGTAVVREVLRDYGDAIIARVHFVGDDDNEFYERRIA